MIVSNFSPFPWRKTERKLYEALQAEIQPETIVVSPRRIVDVHARLTVRPNDSSFVHLLSSLSKVPCVFILHSAVKGTIKEK